MQGAAELRWSAAPSPGEGAAGAQLDMLICEQVLRQIFSGYGQVADVAIKKHTTLPKQHRQTGYGFVYFVDPAAAYHAVRALKNNTVRGITLDCSISHKSEVTQPVHVGAYGRPVGMGGGSSYPRPAVEPDHQRMMHRHHQHTSGSYLSARGPSAAYLVQPPAPDDSTAVPAFSEPFSAYAALDPSAYGGYSSSAAPFHQQHHQQQDGFSMRSASLSPLSRPASSMSPVPLLHADSSCLSTKSSSLWKAVDEGTAPAAEDPLLSAALEGWDKLHISSSSAAADTRACPPPPLQARRYLLALDTRRIFSPLGAAAVGMSSSWLFAPHLGSVSTCIGVRLSVVFHKSSLFWCGDAALSDIGRVYRLP